MTNDEILNLKLDNQDFADYWTIGIYFKELLATLWEEGEGFSGKRPFGNSGWEHDVFAPLVKNGIVQGSLDEDGYIEDINKDQAFKKVYELIDHVFESWSKDK